MFYTSIQHARTVLPCCLSRQCTDILQRLYTLRTPVSNSSQGQSDMVAAPAIWAVPVHTAAKHTKTTSMITKRYCMYVCMHFIFRNTFAFHIATTDNMSKVCII